RSSRSMAPSTDLAPRMPLCNNSSTRVRRTATSENSAATKKPLSATKAGTASSPRTIQSQSCSENNRSPPAPLRVAAYPSLSAGRHVLLQPCEHFLVPELAVGRLQHPVAFVGEIYEFRSHALALQGGEEFMPLADGAAEVEIVLNYEHWRLEFTEVRGKANR